MDQKNQNNNSPFGSYRYGTDEPNRRYGSSNETWTPISTGVPVQTPPKLQDQNEAPRTRQQTGTRQTQQRQTQQRKSQQKTARKPSNGKNTRQQSAASQRPVVRDTQRRSQAPLQRTQRSYNSEQRRLERDHASFEKEQTNGLSRAELRARAAKKKKLRRQVRIAITVIVVMLLAGICALVYCIAYGAPINKINVTGKTTYSNEQIIDASGIQTGDNMLRIRKSEVSRTICEELPYVSSVKVEFKLPDTLVLKVTQAQEKYLIVGKGGYLGLDENGKVLSLKKKKAKEGQYRLEGFDQQTAREGDIYKPENDNVKRFEAAKTLVEQLEKNELKKANLLQLGDLSRIVIQYDGRINIYLSGTSDAESKIALVAGVIKDQISEYSKGYIDARFAGRVFLNEGSMTIDG